MNPSHALLALAGVMLLSVASPGPNFVIVTTTAIASRRAGLAAGLGLAAASGTWALLAIAGLGLLVEHFAWIESLLRVGGAVYLIWLGIKMIATARRPLPASSAPPASGWRAARKAYLVSLTNPKAIAFYGSIFALMMPTQAPAWFDAAVIGLSILISCAWYCGMALLASHAGVRRVLVRRKAVLDSLAGALLVGLGGRMLMGR